jgi:hypothetical protein
MAKFRKKPVVIEAVQLTEEVAAAYLFNDVALPAGVKFSSASSKEGKVLDFYSFVQTLEGRMDVSLGDWIITGVKGEHYPCKPDIFAATYEPA